MKKFRVYLSACADVETTVEVEAENEEEAKKEAVAAAEAGTVKWDYNGVDDTTIEVNEVQGA